MKRPVISNYDKTRDAMEIEFLKYNQTAMIDKFELVNDSGYLYIPFAGRDYRVNRLTGRVEYQCESAKEYIHSDYNVSMTIFDILCYSKPDCRLSGNCVPLSGLKHMVQITAPGVDIFKKKVNNFAGKCLQLKMACEKLGGVPEKIGDVSFRIPLFPFLPVVLQFWDADDEFAPVLKFLWDENILDYMHYETTFFATAHLIDRLIEEGNLIKPDFA